jgi:NAD(P)-dependent dehydrogenase (short-subunit alcohol dehydrogenase family)
VSETSMDRRAFLGGAAALGAAAMVPSAAGARSRGRDGDGREVALITGTSSGFGRLTALTLARSGYEVYASMRHLRDRNAAAARELQEIAGRERLALHVVEIDVRSERSVEAGTQQVLRRAGRVDILVNNAGTFYPALLETLTVEDLQEVFDTNVFGHLRMNRAVLPAMRERGRGLVVQVTSALGRIVLPFQGSYIGAKWAMEGMTQAIGYELRESGVDVAIVEPGAYPTDLIDNAREYYRGYLEGLSREDARRREQYGSLANQVEGELTEPSGPDPQEVADAIAHLAQLPQGERPWRTLVGEQAQFFTEINDVHQRIQNELVP